MFDRSAHIIIIITHLPTELFPRHETFLLAEQFVGWLKWKRKLPTTTTLQHISCTFHLQTKQDGVQRRKHLSEQ